MLRVLVAAIERGRSGHILATTAALSNPFAGPA